LNWANTCLFRLGLVCVALTQAEPGRAYNLINLDKKHRDWFTEEKDLALAISE